MQAKFSGAVPLSGIKVLLASFCPSLPQRARHECHKQTLEISDGLCPDSANQSSRESFLYLFVHVAMEIQLL